MKTYLRHFFFLSMTCLFACWTGLATQAAVYPVAPGTGTLGAADTAAIAGDILELSTGVYDGAIDFVSGKTYTVQAGAGQSPIIRDSDGNDVMTILSQITFNNIKFEAPVAYSIFFQS